MTYAQKSLAFAAAALLASAALAAEPVTVDTFTSALRDGSASRAMKLWPARGSVKLFGKRLDLDAALSLAKYDDGIGRLFRWPKEADKGVEPEVEKRQEGKATLYTVRPKGAAAPVCTLKQKKAGAELLLVECK
jgi:hypothetical protein